MNVHEKMSEEGTSGETMELKLGDNPSGRFAIYITSFLSDQIPLGELVQQSHNRNELLQKKL